MATNVIAVKADKPSLEDNIVTLLIGEKQTPYIVHGKVLAQRLQGRTIPHLKRDGDGTLSIQIDTASTAAYKLWLHLLHTGRMPLWEDKPAKGEQDRVVQKALDALIELYSFAMTIADHEAAGAAIIGAFELYHKPSYGHKGTLPAIASIVKAYSMASASSDMRQFLVQIYSEYADPGKIDSRLPVDFLVDLTKAAIKRANDLVHRVEEDDGVAEEISNCSAKLPGTDQSSTSRGNKKRKFDDVERAKHGKIRADSTAASNIALVPTMKQGTSALVKIDFDAAQSDPENCRNWSPVEVIRLAAASRSLTQPQPRLCSGLFNLRRGFPWVPLPDFDVVINEALNDRKYLPARYVRALMIRILSHEAAASLDLDKFRQLIRAQTVADAAVVWNKLSKKLMLVGEHSGWSQEQAMQ
ncbi:hypothetical protein Slin15195_G124930 [Septoria linicola]|uniref:Uncharacterized protein n=1 Tax=Septoria linicola TaxID=215465 RepID=A0A9Q9EQU5_9PEZI|nr:hypothetical protein Slin14017_G081120 [Septoria linicola]USW59174.1 hypothetical protein Slin15195_G124930 [Septoria linicola]